jgi:DNA-binding MarR family transcriptional regulator
MKIDSTAPSGNRTSQEAKHDMDAQILAFARLKYDLRRRRSIILPDAADLFHDPAWDILLDLFIAAETNAQISVSSACIASGVPPTTALRTLKIMENRGILRGECDRDDARRRFVSLSDTMREQMRTLLIPR